MALHIPFDNTYARLPDSFFAPQAPEPVRAPELIAFNHGLAYDLGLTGAEDPDLAQILAGNRLPEGADPLAQAYSGHQFGQFNPGLGDGRAVLLGEVVDRAGHRRDIQLKGSGRTPFARRGDGRAWLGPVLREYLVSEAMYALGVPTTRALAAVRTGQEVIRDRPLPGAVLTRVASSHLRVGSFQYFAARQDYAGLQILFDYAVQRHYPQADDPGVFLSAVIENQADLVAQWVSLGFIHGVMNTDNCAISGETIDYGPCAFMDGYDPGQVYSSIDRKGRYAYGAQADIILWNMAQLATALVPLMPDQDAAIADFTRRVHAMADLIRERWVARFGAKLGLSQPAPEDARLIRDLLALMQAGGSDFTNTFRALAEDGSARDQLLDRPAYDAWHARWRARLEREDQAEALMLRSNPAFIPRNHRIEEVITAAVDGDDAPFHRLHGVLANPYADQPDAAAFRRPPAPHEVVPATFCGT